MLGHANMCLGILLMVICSRYKDVPRHARCQGMLSHYSKAYLFVPSVLMSARSLSLIELTQLDYVLNNIVLTHTTRTLFKGNLLDNKPNRD